MDARCAQHPPAVSAHRLCHDCGSLRLCILSHLLQKAQANSDPFDSRGTADAGLLLLCSREGIGSCFSHGWSNLNCAGNGRAGRGHRLRQPVSDPPAKSRGFAGWTALSAVQLGGTGGRAGGYPFLFGTVEGGRELQPAQPWDFSQRMGAAWCAAAQRGKSADTTAAAQHRPNALPRAGAGTGGGHPVWRDAAAGAALLPHDAGRGIGPHPGSVGTAHRYGGSLLPKGSGKGRHLPSRSRADFTASGLGIHCADRLFPFGGAGRHYGNPCRLGMGAGQRARRAEFTGGGSLLDAAAFSLSAVQPVLPAFLLDYLWVAAVRSGLEPIVGAERIGCSPHRQKRNASFSARTFQYRLFFTGSRYLRDAGAALPLSCAFGVERSGSGAFAVGGSLG